MESWREQFIVMAHRPLGLFLFLLIAADIVAIFAGGIAVAAFRIRRHLYLKYRYQHSLALRPCVEALIAGDGSRLEEFLALSNKLKRAELGSMFLEYDRLVAGEYRERLVAAFLKTSLPQWSVAASKSRRWWPRLQSVRIIPLAPDDLREKMLIQFLNDSHPFVRVYAVQAATEHPTPGVIDALFKRLENKDAGFELFALKDALTRLGFSVSERLVSFMLEDHEIKSMTTALEVAEKLNDPVFIIPMLALLKNATGEIQAAAARALASYPDELVVTELRTALRSENDDTRAMAAYSLGKLSNPAVVPDLYAALPDRAWKVRYHCAAALKKLGPAGLEALNNAQSHEDHFVVDITKYILSLPDFALVT